MVEDLIFYERHLPHWLPPGEDIFLTFRLADSLPQELLGRLQDEAQRMQSCLDLNPAQLYAERKRYFGRFDDFLASAGHGPNWLRQPEIAAIVKQSLHHFDSSHYQLLAYCLMPNHVHLLVRLSEESPPLMRTLQRIKGFSALQANQGAELYGEFLAIGELRPHRAERRVC